LCDDYKVRNAEGNGVRNPGKLGLRVVPGIVKRINYPVTVQDNGKLQGDRTVDSYSLTWVPVELKVILEEHFNKTSP
jgi:hypothetical protein